jgi:PAS domain-containing protein
MSTAPDFQDFAESLRARREEMRRAAPDALLAVGRELSPPARATLVRASALLESTLDDLGAAADELESQNEALFAARAEMDAQGRFYRELFDLAPAALLVTTAEARITHVNHAATALFGRSANALVGRPLVGLVDAVEREAFRDSLARAIAGPLVEEWPMRLLRHGAPAAECRLRVSARLEAGVVHALQWIVVESGDADVDLL